MEKSNYNSDPLYRQYPFNIIRELELAAIKERRTHLGGSSNQMVTHLISRTDEYFLELDKNYQKSQTHTFKGRKADD